MTQAQEILEAARASAENTYQPQVIAPYQYWAKVKRIVDGDTIDLGVEVGFGITVNQRFRLLGINAPELRGPTREAGRLAAARLAELAPVDTWVEVRTFTAQEKFGRYLADVLVDTTNVSETLLREGHAVPLLPP